MDLWVSLSLFKVQKPNRRRKIPHLCAHRPSKPHALRSDQALASSVAPLLFRRPVSLCVLKSPKLKEKPVFTDWEKQSSLHSNEILDKTNATYKSNKNLNAKRNPMILSVLFIRPLKLCIYISLENCLIVAK